MSRAAKGSDIIIHTNLANSSARTVRRVEHASPYQRSSAGSIGKSATTTPSGRRRGHRGGRKHRKKTVETTLEQSATSTADTPRMSVYIVLYHFVHCDESKMENIYRTYADAENAVVRLLTRAGVEDPSDAWKPNADDYWSSENGSFVEITASYVV